MKGKDAKALKTAFSIVDSSESDDNDESVNARNVRVSSCDVGKLRI